MPDSSRANIHYRGRTTKLLAATAKACVLLFIDGLVASALGGFDGHYLLVDDNAPACGAILLEVHAESSAWMNGKLVVTNPKYVLLRSASLVFTTQQDRVVGIMDGAVVDVVTPSQGDERSNEHRRYARDGVAMSHSAGSTIQINEMVCPARLLNGRIYGRPNATTSSGSRPVASTATSWFQLDRLTNSVMHALFDASARPLLAKSERASRLAVTTIEIRPSREVGGECEFLVKGTVHLDDQPASAGQTVGWEVLYDVAGSPLQAMVFSRDER